MSNTNEQIREIRDYFKDLPSKVRALFDTPEKQERYNQKKEQICDVFDRCEKYRQESEKNVSVTVNISQYQKELEREEALMKWAEEYYSLSPVKYPITEEPAQNPDEKLFAAYYIIAKLDDMLNDPEQTKELFENEFTYDNGNDTLSRMGIIEAEYPQTLIRRLEEALQLIQTNIEQVQAELASSGKADSPIEKTKETLLWKLYEKTIKAAFDAILDKLNTS